MNTDPKNNQDGWIFEFDLKYSERLHNLHSDFFLTFKKTKPKKVCYQIIVKKIQVSVIFHLVVSENLYHICAIERNVFFITEICSYNYSNK